MLGGKKFIGGLALAMAMTVAVGVGVGTGVLLGSEKFTGEEGSTASSQVTPPPASENNVSLAAEHSSHPEGEWEVLKIGYDTYMDETFDELSGDTLRRITRSPMQREL